MLTRISKVTVKAEPETHECKDCDEEWGRLISLEIVPHPKNIKYATAIELDYAMEEGVLTLEVRAAMAGYLLRRWNVDCTKHASLRTGEYQLWLRNQQSLANTDNLASENERSTIPLSSATKTKEKISTSLLPS